MPDLDLGSLWFSVAVHLWQSTLVLLVIFVLARLLRRAPARVQHLLWSLALVKFFLPLELLGGLFRSLVDRALPAGVGGPFHLDGLMTPAILVVHPANLLPPLRDPFTLISLVWVAGVVLLLTLWLRGLARDRKNRLFRPAVDQTHTGLASAVAGSGIPLERITLLRGRAMPFVTGIFRPRILLPVTLIEKLQTLELRAILLHEDAHRRRRDPFFCLFQRIAFLIFYYHPLLWPLMRRLHSTRELACDEHVLARGIPSEVYARALAKTVNLCLAPASTAQAAACGPGTLFSRRLSSITAHRDRRLLLRHVVVLAIAGLVVTLGSFSPFQQTVDARQIEPPAAMETTEEDEEPEAAPRSEPLLPGEAGVTPPKRIQHTSPDYPEKARNERVESRVMLQAVILEDGSITEIEVLSCTRPGFGFEDAATEAVSRWRYEPATKDGKPVAVFFTIKIDFTLE